MQHFHALSLAALLRWRRKLLATLSYPAESGGDEEEALAWRRFEQNQIRIAVRRAWCLSWLAAVISLASCILAYLDSGQLDRFLTAMPIFVVCLFDVHLQRRIRLTKEGSEKEWWWCILHQCLLTFFAFICPLSACFLEDTLLAHRMFCLKWMFALMIMVVMVYLPLKLRLFCVTCQSALVWAVFHKAMHYLRCVPVFLMVALPAVELVCFCFARNQCWQQFCVTEKEKKARVLSDALQETLRGVLNVMFDASCDCDNVGKIVCSSQHLQDLLGRSMYDLAGLDLMELAASPMEASRIKHFLAQISSQQQETGPRSASLLAQLETVLVRHHRTAGESDNQLTVKIFCVSLPGGTDPLPSGRGCRSLFVGLQLVPGGDSYPAESKDSTKPSIMGIDVASRQTLADSSHADADAAAINEDIESEGEASLSYSCTQFSAAAGTRSIMQVAIQTEALCQQNASTQTEHVPEQMSAPSRDQVRPGYPPRPSSPGNKNGSRLVDVTLKRARRRASAKNPHIGVPFLQRFHILPIKCVELQVIELLQMMNPPKSKVKCCFFHVSLHYLHAVLLQMCMQHCSCKSFVCPNMEWQCPDCFAMNENNDDGVDGEAVCEHCSCQKPDVNFKARGATRELSSGDDLANLAGSSRSSASESSASDVS